MRALVVAAWAGVLAGCPVGLDQPMLGLDGGPVIGADTLAGFADARADSGPAIADDAAPADGNALDADTDAAPGPDDGGVSADATAPDGGEPTEACNALAPLMCRPIVELTSATPVRLVRVAPLTVMESLVAVATDDRLIVIQLGTARPTTHLSLMLPPGAVLVDLAIASDGSDWIVYLATDRELLCRGGEVNGMRTTDSVTPLANIRALDADHAYGFNAVILTDQQIMRVGGRECGDMPAPIAARSGLADVALIPEERDLVAVADTSTVSGGAVLSLTHGGRWPLTRPVTAMQIDAVSPGNNLFVGALATRTATAPGRALLEVLGGDDSAAMLTRGPTRIIDSEIATATCGSGCTAIAYAPAIARDRIEVIFVSNALRYRSPSTGPLRAACTTNGPVRSLDARAIGQSVALVWAEASAARLVVCDRP